ncbi:MAG: NIL domain-containing protein [Fischerella sp. CENA71]|nr:NIL domain-containing protein [Fischerella sp. CENA71]
MDVSTTFNPTQGCIEIRVPEKYHRQPIISRLISRYDLSVNIAAAAFEIETKKDGWLNLEIQGSSQQLESGITYLRGLSMKVEQLNFPTLTEQKIKDLQILCPNYVKKLDEGKITQYQTNHAKFQVCISKNYRSFPIIAGLVTYCGLTVNITQALLDTNNENDGWFNLEIWGDREQIVSGLRYLKQLDLQIWL